MLGWLFKRRPRSPLAAAELLAASKLQCKKVHDLRQAQAAATRAGLMLSVAPEIRDRVAAKLALAAEARG